MSGVLYVVATAIGNLADMSDRARAVLAEVDLIACEDTRASGRLLRALGITAELVSYHDHNEGERVERLLAMLQAGRSIALISDAGTPLINDPGYVLVRAARAAALPVVPLPGPCALIAALSAAGLPSDRFLFVGFPPRGQSERRAWLTGLASEPGTLICYESARRASATLADVAAVLGPRPAVLARELTKPFETFLGAEAGALAARIAADPEQQLGEAVLLIGGDRRSTSERAEAEAARILALLAAELPLKQAVTLTARITGGNRNQLYQRALAERASNAGE